MEVRRRGSRRTYGFMLASCSRGRVDGVRVLVAEDDERLATLLDQVLSEAGHAASVVHDGPAALQAARRGGFDVLLLDWMLPGLEGPDVLRALRDDGYDTPALLLTARGALRDRVD